MTMLAVFCRGSCYFCQGLQQQTTTAARTLFVSSSSRWQRNYVMRTIHNSWITTLHTRSSKGNDDGTTSSTASCTTTVSSSKSHNRRYNVSPSVQRRIQNLISHPAVRWDGSSTFASMHGKKLKQRHLKLFDRTLTMMIMIMLFIMTIYLINLQKLFVWLVWLHRRRYLKHGHRLFTYILLF